MQQVKGTNRKDSEYKIGHSILMDGIENYFSRTWDNAPTNAKKNTLSFWIKRADIDTYQYIWSSGNGTDEMQFPTSQYGAPHGCIQTVENAGSGAICYTKSVNLDVASWYHVCIWKDSTIPDNRIFINGILQEKTQDNSFILNYDTSMLANGSTLQLGLRLSNFSSSLHGAIAEWHVIDGQALGPEWFGQHDGKGIYKPIPYAGTYGNNGFYLKFDMTDDQSIGHDYSGNDNNFFAYNNSGNIIEDSPTNNYCTLNPLDPTGSTYSNGNLTTTGNATTTFDGIDGKWYYEKDGVGVTVDGSVGTVGAGTYNFGQRSWANEPPAGYESLCTDNLPASLVNPNRNFKAVLSDGNGGTQSIDVGWQPDLTWTKVRDVTDNHVLVDSIRGDKLLHSNTVDSEEPTGVNWEFDPLGFTMNGHTGSELNGAGYKYVHWNFRGGNNIVPNNDGSIPSMVSANRDMGFSIVSFTGNFTDMATIGHGLGVIPKLLLFKSRTTGNNWAAFTDEIGWDRQMYLNKDLAAEGSTGLSNQSPTSTTIILGSHPETNLAGEDYIVYCFANTEMLKVGSYMGNGNTGLDGQFVSLPFKPAFFMNKAITGTGQWFIYDNEREGYNPDNAHLYADNPNAEGAGLVDFMSNGVKLNTDAVGTNYLNYQYLYLAISDKPFKYTRGR